MTLRKYLPERLRRCRVAAAALLASALVTTAGAQAPAPVTVPADCPRCAAWTQPQNPFRIFGNTYYVGSRELSAILITSDAGHVLIDASVQEGAAQVAANVRALGFRVKDIRLILNSHAHFDHAGGIAALQRMSGARVAASPWSARVLEQGHSLYDDPQYASLLRGPGKLAQVQVISDGQTLAVGPLRLTAHFTPGHTPGGTSWTWDSCEQSRCLHIVYADSLNPVSAPQFKFSQSTSYPAVLEDFQKSFAVLAKLPCDVLLTPHPEVADILGRLQRRDSGADRDAFVNPGGCSVYADRARADLAHRIVTEQHTR
jgi:metallo-beta-lactamase class B